MRSFGVEIETSHCTDISEFDGRYNWDVHSDASIRGDEFASRILNGYAGLQAVRDLCEYANNNGWTVDEDCGLHVHFDMRGESDDSLKAIALAYKLTYEVWKQFVDSDRHNSSWCRPNRADYSSIFGARDFEYFAYEQSRYEYFNLAAYSKHSTFEVRLHEGSLDGERICNWIKAHLAFIDWASQAGWAKVRNTMFCMNTAEKTDFIVQLWYKFGYAEVAEYYEGMIYA